MKKDGDTSDDSDDNDEEEEELVIPTTGSKPSTKPVIEMMNQD
jgi:hypothetical protein